MRRLFYGGFAIFAGIGEICAPAPQPAPAADYRNDPRWPALQKFFGKTGCPAREYSHIFLEAADDYALDWRLLPSISFVESTGGKAARNNNMFGWDNGNARFASPAEGIHTVGYRLAYSGLYKDKELDQLLTTYNRNE